MKNQALFAFVLGVAVLVQGQGVWAAPCNYGNNTESFNQQITASGTNWYAPNNNNLSLTFSGLVNCQNQISNNQARYKLASFSLSGSNINFSSAVTISNKTYYKLINTGNAYLDNYAYVAFGLSYSSNNSSNHTATLAQDVELFSGPTPKVSGSFSHESATQGITLTGLRFYFTAAPTSTLSKTISLGRIHLTVSPNANNSPSYTDSKDILLNFNLTPVNNRTCSFSNFSNNNLSVTLPEIQTSLLSTMGSEAGQTSFTITASCATQFPNNTILYAAMLDNNDITNISNQLTNTIAATNNVKIKIYDAATNLPVSFNNEFTFGTLTTANSKTVSKNFYARYIKTNSAPTNAGNVNAVATISVFYK